MRLGLVSAKGSPGVTTLALGAAAIIDAIAVELDPSGGLRLRGLVAAPDGSRLVSGEWGGPAIDAERIGREGGAELRARADFLPG